MMNNLKNEAFFNEVKKFFFNENLTCISGKSGTGKTSLALHLVGEILDEDDACIWIQASEHFPRKRMHQIFKSHPDKLKITQENVYIIPSRSPIRSYKEQALTIDKIVIPHSNLPPNLKLIIIDNISHHLRFERGCHSDISRAIRVLDDFYEHQLCPLIVFCQYNDIGLVLLHEVTFDPKSSRTRPFFFKLYDRLRSLDIMLRDEINSSDKKMEIISGDFNSTFTYTIEQRGLVIS